MNMSFELLALEDVCVDCVITVLEQTGDPTEAEIAIALRSGRQDPRRDYEHELAAVAPSWPRLVQAAEHICRRQFKRCPD